MHLYMYIKIRLNLRHNLLVSDNADYDKIIWVYPKCCIVLFRLLETLLHVYSAVHSMTPLMPLNVKI